MEPFSTIQESKEWAAEQIGGPVCFLLGAKSKVAWFYDRFTGKSTSCTEQTLEMMREERGISRSLLIIDMHLRSEGRKQGIIR